MQKPRIILAVAILLVAAAKLIASGPCGFYAIVDKVIFEPNEKAPERVQVWGAFAVVDGGVDRPGATSRPIRGYLYFKLPNNASAAKAEWQDLKSAAGTGQAVAFGNWFAPTPDYFAMQNIHAVFDPKAEPFLYQTNTGIVKLPAEGSHANIIRQLRETLKGG